ncbi:MAG: LuxR C-terminal-related transcriptional regulator, partial [Agrococcus sp.]
QHARRALAAAGPDDHLGRGAGGGLLGLALWAKGDLAGAVPTFAAASESLELAGHVADAVSSAVVMADMLVAQGRRRAAWAALERAVRLASSHGEQSTVDLHVSMSELRREEDDLAAALEHLHAASVHRSHPAVPENAHRWFVAMARVEEARGDLDAALVLLDEAERRYLRGYFPDVRPITAMRARVWIRRGELDKASAWIDEQGVAAADEPRYLDEFAHITLVRLLIARFRSDGRAGALTDASLLLERLLDAADAGGRGGSAAEILVLQSLVFDAQGKTSRAQQSLQRALAHAEAEGYRRLFADEGAPMARLLETAARDGKLPRQLRSLRRAPAAVADATGAAEQLSERELTVLQLLTTELSGPQIARELFVSLNTLRTHTKHIFGKLAVNSRPAAVRRAREKGLI